MKKAVIILPTYNEKRNVQSLVESIFSITEAKCPSWDVHILVVDDMSPDNTADEVKKLQKKFSRLHMILGKKSGLGRAYLRGFKEATSKLRADVVFEMDADWSHDPNLIPKFLKKIDEGADFVIGSRYVAGGSIPKRWAPHRKLFSTIGNLIVRFGLMKRHIRDWTSGFRAIRTNFISEILPQMRSFNGYVFQVALLHKAETAHLSIAEIPLQFKDRKEGVSKINAAQYILNTLVYVFANSSFIKYVIVGLIGFAIDFGISYALIEQMNTAVWIATLTSTETAIVSNFLLNNFWSFSDKQISKEASVYISKFFHFNLVSAGSIAIQTLSLQAITTFFPKNYWPFYKAGIILFIIIPYSWVLYNRLIWKTTRTS